MGEWSEHFEDFPEEDPGNYVNGIYSEDLARRRKQAAHEAEFPKAPRSAFDLEKKVRQEQNEILMRLKGLRD